MIKKVRGLGILYAGEYEFLILPASEGEDIKIPASFNDNHNGTYFCARRFEIAKDKAEFRAPAWITVLGGGFIRWYPDEQYFDVEFPENTAQS